MMPPPRSCPTAGGRRPRRSTRRSWPNCRRSSWSGRASKRHIETDAGKPGPSGIDRIEFMVAANPGTPLAPLMKVASGGELARFMLALKVVLAAKGSAPTLIFDEIDTGVGGAVADAIGARLARLAEGLQVLAVTHSPQVAARAGQHMLISKMEEVAGKRMVTRVQAPVGAEPARGNRTHAVGRAGDGGGPCAGGRIVAGQGLGVAQQADCRRGADARCRLRRNWRGLRKRSQNMTGAIMRMMRRSSRMPPMTRLRRRNDAIEARFPDLVRGDSPSRGSGQAQWRNSARSQHRRADAVALQWLLGRGCRATLSGGSAASSVLARTR